MNTLAKDNQEQLEGIFSVLYRTYWPAVYRLAYRLLGDREEAGDITQETFSRLYEALGDGGEILFPKSWIFTVAANVCRDFLRKQRKAKDVVSHRREDARDAGSEKDLELKREVEALRLALRRLKERDQILVMLYLDDLSYKELAQATGIRSSSIGKTLSRAIEKLANMIRNGD
jgi:RNA polymerase sigma-70 factor (ECF subfamily)